MKKVNNGAKGFTAPSVEISVRSGKEELAAIAFYEVTGGAWDVLVGCGVPAYRDNLATVLRWAADAVESAAFPLGDTAGFDDDGHEQNPLDAFPF